MFALVGRSLCFAPSANIRTRNARPVIVWLVASSPVVGAVVAAVARGNFSRRARHAWHGQRWRCGLCPRCDVCALRPPPARSRFASLAWCRAPPQGASPRRFAPSRSPLFFGAGLLLLWRGTNRRHYGWSWLVCCCGAGVAAVLVVVALAAPTCAGLSIPSRNTNQRPYGYCCISFIAAAAIVVMAQGGGLWPSSCPIPQAYFFWHVKGSLCRDPHPFGRAGGALRCGFRSRP